MFFRFRWKYEEKNQLKNIAFDCNIANFSNLLCKLSDYFIAKIAMARSKYRLKFKSRERNELHKMPILDMH